MWIGFTLFQNNLEYWSTCAHTSKSCFSHSCEQNSLTLQYNKFIPPAQQLFPPSSNSSRANPSQTTKSCSSLLLRTTANYDNIGGPTSSIYVGNISRGALIHASDCQVLWRNVRFKKSKKQNTKLIMIFLGFLNPIIICLVRYIMVDSFLTDFEKTL